MSCKCERHSSHGSGFVLGLFIGAMIGAVIAIYVYKNNKSDIIRSLKKFLEKYLKGFTTSNSAEKVPRRVVVEKPSKISVTIPSQVESIDIAPQKSPKPRKMFSKK